MDRVLLGCGTVADPLFVGVFLLTGALRPAYDPLRHPVSLLALGPGGWVQSLNFCVSGLLYLAFAAGLWRARGPWTATRAGIVLVAATAAGLVDLGGLFQRVSITAGMGWLTALAAGALRAARVVPRGPGHP